MSTITLVQLVLFALPLPQPEAIQQAGLDARKKIVSGDMEFEIYEGIPPKNAQQEVEWKLNVRDRLIFDTRPGWSAYLERWQPHEPVLLKDGETLIQRAPNGGNRLRIVLSPTQCLQFVPDELTGGRRFGITSDDPRAKPIESKIVMHPWRFGLIPENFAMQYNIGMENLGAYIAPLEQRDVVIEEDHELGNRCWRITFRRDNGRRVAAWFDPSQGMNVRKVVETGATKYGPFVVSATSTLQYHSRAGVWYPGEIQYRGVTNNDEQDASLEKLVVTRADFNIDIDPLQFTAKALEAPPQTLILSRKREPGPTKQWDGEKVAPVTAMFPLTKDITPQSPASSITIRQMFVVVGMILLLVAAVFGLSRKSNA